MPQSQIWLRRQEIQQQVLIGLAPKEGVERTNVAVVNPNQQTGFTSRQD